MRATMKKMLAAGLSLSMILALASCGDSKQKDATSDVAYGQVWSAPSAVKIERDDIEYANKREAVLSYQAVRNEYESNQLIITADKEVEHFELQVSDLKSGKEVLSRENITVYVEKYIPYSGYSGSGNMPDALIPMSAADEYEENTIKAGQNGALWVTIYVPAETEAGVYEGTFQLIMDGEKGEEKLDVPVSVEVHDYTLADEDTARTLFSWRYDRVAAGELDGSIEMMTRYYEFFLDYRVSLQSMPLETLSGEEYTDALLKYYDELTSFSILKTVGDVAHGLYDKETEVMEQILAVASVSTPEKNLFDKAMIYCIDEPNFTQEAIRKNVITNIGKMDAILQKCVDTIKADQTGAYDTFKQIENWESSILDIPNIIPIVSVATEWLLANENTEEGQALLEALSCIAPYFYDVNDETIEQLNAMGEKYGIKLWWYGCLAPKAPAPTYHIGDDNLLSSRTVSWLQSMYEVEGNLYWDAAAYTNEADDIYNEYINVYEEPYRDTTTTYPAGDGFLAYPGAAYGIEGPLPSMRLMSIRDGMEEYELLQDVKEALETKVATFGSTVNKDVVMDEFYSAVAADISYMYADGEKSLDFTALRTELIELVAGMNNGTAFIIGDRIVQGEKATVTYYAQSGATVTIDGEVQTPIEGSTYQYDMDLAKDTSIHLTIANADGKSVSYDRFVTNPVYTMNDLSDESAMKGIKVSDGSTAELVSDDTNSTDGTAVHFNVQGVVTGNTLIDASFAPSVSVDTAIFGDLQPANVKNVEIDVYNPSQEFTVNIKLYSGSSYMELGDFVISSGKNTLKLDMTQQFKNIDTADRLVFSFANVVNEQPATYDFYLDNIVADK